MSENAVFDQGLHCLHTEISIIGKIKMKKYTGHPLNEKWASPIDKDWIVHWTNKGQENGARQNYTKEMLFRIIGSKRKL